MRGFFIILLTFWPWLSLIYDDWRRIGGVLKFSCVFAFGSMRDTTPHFKSRDHSSKVDSLRRKNLSKLMVVAQWCLRMAYLAEFIRLCLVQQSPSKIYTVLLLGICVLLVFCLVKFCTPRSCTKCFVCGNSSQTYVLLYAPSCSLLPKAKQYPQQDFFYLNSKRQPFLVYCSLFVLSLDEICW